MKEIVMAQLHILTDDVDATLYAIDQLDVPHGSLTIVEPRRTSSGWVQPINGPRHVLREIAKALNVDMDLCLRDDDDDDSVPPPLDYDGDIVEQAERRWTDGARYAVLHNWTEDDLNRLED